MMHLVVLGDPVAHSLSPAIHTAALHSVGLAGTYLARTVDADGLRAAIDEMRRGELDGANVTMPHKRLAARLVDQLAATAARAGAVNTLVRVGDTVIGHNTDIAGIRLAWEGAGLPDDGPILVLGAGGAAAAAMLALEHRSPSISARRPEQARALLDDLSIDAAIVPWGGGVDGAVIVNATALGMAGEALPVAEVGRSAGLFEMPYAAGPTPTALAFRAAGLPVAEGPDMLLGQAIWSFRLWTGCEPDAAAMRAAMVPGLRG